MSRIGKTEQSAFTLDTSARARTDEKAVAEKLQETIARNCGMHVRKGYLTRMLRRRESSGVGESTGNGAACLYYRHAKRLREVLTELATVENLEEMLLGSKKSRALVYLS